MKVLYCAIGFYKETNEQRMKTFHLDDMQQTETRIQMIINFPNIDWYTGSPFRSDPSTEEFCHILGDFFLIQKNMSTTRGLGITEGNILDLVLTNNEFLVRDVSVHPNATRKQISLACGRLYITYLGNQLSLTAHLRTV